MGKAKKIGIGIGVAVVAFFALSILAYATYKAPATQTNDALPSNSNTPTGKVQPPTVNDIMFNVTGLHVTKNEKSQTLVLYITLKNTGNNPAVYTGIQYMLADSAGRNFGNMDNSVNDYAFIQKQLNPGLTVDRTLMFEIPNAPSDYRLNIGKVNESPSLYIELGTY